jgi:hypothetical protein
LVTVEVVDATQDADDKKTTHAKDKEDKERRRSKHELRLL